jgi:transposase
LGAHSPAFANGDRGQPVSDRRLDRQGPPARNGGPKKGDSCCEEIGRSRGGLTTKLAALTDRNGRPAALDLAPGQAHDLAASDELIEAIPEGALLVGDKAFDSDAFVAALEERGVVPNIPNRANRKTKRGFFPSLYKLRNGVERFFNKLKHFRRIATRYDKRADNYLAMCQLASARILIRSL